MASYLSWRTIVKREHPTLQVNIIINYYLNQLKLQLPTGLFFFHNVLQKDNALSFIQNCNVIDCKASTIYEIIHKN